VRGLRGQPHERLAPAPRVCVPSPQVLTTDTASYSVRGSEVDTQLRGNLGSRVTSSRISDGSPARQPAPRARCSGSQNGSSVRRSRSSECFSGEETGHLLRNDHLTVREPHEREAGTRRLLIGRTDGAPCVTLVIERTEP